MQTRALITLVKKQAPEWSPENIRELVNEVQNILLMKRPVGFMRMLDTTTGKDPVLTTVAGTYEYEISEAEGFPADAGFVYEVHTGDPDTPVENVHVAQATNTDAATLTFDEDPGSTDYYVWCYKKPEQITAVTTELTVPMAYHMDTVFEGVVGLVEKMSSGVSDRWEKFEKVLCPKFWADQNRGNRRTSYIVKPRGF
jgi:hypothetical protein